MLKTQNILNDEDLIESFYVNEFNNKIANIKLNMEKLIKLLKNCIKRFNFETDGEFGK